MLFMRRRSSPTDAFTLIELLVATAVFLLMASLLLSMSSQVNTAWQQALGQKTRRENARQIFSLLQRDLQAAIPVLPGTATNAVPFQLLVDYGGEGSAGLFWLASLPSTRTSSDVATVGYFVAGNHRLYRTFTNAAVPNFPDLVDQSGSAEEEKGLLAENILRMDVSLIGADGAEIAPPAIHETNLPRFADVTLVVADERTLARQPNLTVPDLLNPPKGVQVFRARMEIPAAQ
jgi:prepilin-type N-terminal cleavage/methylation domain-containing protein